VAQDTLRSLNIEGCRTFGGGFDRPNLKFEVCVKPPKAGAPELAVYRSCMLCTIAIVTDMHSLQPPFLILLPFLCDSCCHVMVCFYLCLYLWAVDVFAFVLQIVRGFPADATGIIYCMTQKETMHMADYLRSSNVSGDVD
jgi:superfamily II DNA helicase RecQ